MRDDDRMPDPSPPPAGLLRQSWWRARDYAAVVRWQAQGLVSRVDPEHLRNPERPVGPPVVLLPGVYESWHFLLPIATFLHEHGVRVHVLPDLRNNRRPVSQGAEVLGQYLVTHDLRDAVLVAHSKGGLIGKLAMLRQDPDGRIDSMIAVNTPFSGSAYARWFLAPSVRAFIPSDATIVALAGERDVNARITSVYSNWDPHIPAGSALDGAQDVVLTTPGHFRPLADPALHELLLERLLSPGEAAARG